MIRSPETHIQEAFAGGRTDIIKAATEAVESAVREALEACARAVHERLYPLPELDWSEERAVRAQCADLAATAIRALLPSPPSPNPETDNG
jgi:hypothetical protein